MPGLDRQRIDKWLWHARIVRTRPAAAALAASGHVRINGRRVVAASHAVWLGDVVTGARERAVRVLKVVGFAERRGSAAAASTLCDAINPVEARAIENAPPLPARREAGAGRPSKRDRRAIDRFRGEERD